MQQPVGHAEPLPPSLAPNSEGVPSNGLAPFLYALFFAWGGITSLNDIIIPKLKALFDLTYLEAMLVQSAFFAAYLVVSVPAALIVDRAGYMRAVVIGLVTMMAGCLLFAPASVLGLFFVFLLALFVLAAGITVLQVAANPLMTVLGPPATASSRLTFAQAFNSLGTTVFPFVGSMLFLDTRPDAGQSRLAGAALATFRHQESRTVMQTYIWLAAALALVAAAIWSQRNKLQLAPPQRAGLREAFALLARPRFAYGVLCIFLYVGAEVAIGSLIVSYLMQANVFAADAANAGKHVAYYWGGALVGRFIGGIVMRIIAPGGVLATAAAGSIILILLAANTGGPISGWALLAIGLCNAIMFPTIFALACDGLGEQTADGSGLLCMAIVGGAIVPPVTGGLADCTSLRLALALPAVCYALIGGFGLFTSIQRQIPVEPNDL